MKVNVFYIVIKIVQMTQLNIINFLIVNKYNKKKMLIKIIIVIQIIKKIK